MMKIYKWIKNKTASISKQLPLVLVFFIMLMPLTMVLIKKISPHKYNRLLQFDAPALSDTPETKAHWSWKEMLVGTWQKKFETKISNTIPFRAMIVRLHNQVFYSLFSKSYMSNEGIIIGKNEFLYQKSYIVKYCNPLNLNYSKASFEQWADDVKAIENFFKNRGQNFVFIITPSKAAYYPEYIPSNFPCSATLTRVEYKAARSALINAGVSFVDGSDITLKQKKQYGELMFPRGGIHWSSLATAFTAQEVLTMLAKSGTPVTKLTFDYVVDKNPVGYDVDVLNLANLYHPPMNYIVPHLTLKQQDSKKPLKLAFVGGSFLTALIENLHQSEMFASIDYYFYLDKIHFQYKSKLPRMVLTSNLDKSNINNFKEIFDADVVILEENESVLRSPHIEKLINMLNKTQHAQLSYHRFS